MTTFEEARRSGEDSWNVIAKLVNKRIFFTKDQNNQPLRLLSLTFIDYDGCLVDVQTWRTPKVFCVHRKMVVDGCYEIAGRGPIETPNKEFSTSKYLVKRGGWWIDPIDSFKLKKYISCSINMNKMIKVTKSGQPENVLGVFMDLTEGPAKLFYKRPVVQGYFVRMHDEDGYQYKVLVWHNTNIKGNKFSLLNALPGDDVLITCVRSSYLHPSEDVEDRTYTLTSIVPPVLNSQCVSYKRREDLKGSVRYEHAI